MRISKRSSPSFFRVFWKSNGKELRFQLELKKLYLKIFNILKRIITILNDLKDYKLIKSKLHVLTKQNKLKKIDKLTPNLGSRSKSIFSMENIDNKNNFNIFKFRKTGYPLSFQ